MSSGTVVTARRTVEAGRNGNTVGTSICADLRCSDRVRTAIPPRLHQRDPVEGVGERTAELRERAEGFLASVRRECVERVRRGASDGA